MWADMIGKGQLIAAHFTKGLSFGRYPNVTEQE
jgi:hypothetical protein